jgi:hypothetical protein
MSTFNKSPDEINVFSETHRCIKSVMLFEDGCACDENRSWYIRHSREWSNNCGKNT